VYTFCQNDVAKKKQSVALSKQKQCRSVVLFQKKKSPMLDFAVILQSFCIGAKGYFGITSVDDR
jgi:hypothetical protein